MSAMPSARAFGDRDGSATHVVSVPRTFLYPQADLKLPPWPASCRWARPSRSTGLAVTRGTRYACLPSRRGACPGASQAAWTTHADDFVAVAETLLHTPYLWGGATPFGIDCSGLVQLSMRMAGRSVLRDTDMQAETIGEPLDPGSDFSNLRRGDLVFWKGHVAIMTDAEDHDPRQRPHHAGLA